MVGRVIRDYIEGGAKKLTVPGFGTFMRRDGGGVIFVDLMRTDDGVLGEMVEDAASLSEVEAMARIDRFIFETKNAIERNGRAAIEGFGVMTIDHKGVYQFEYSPKARPVREHAVQERLFEQERLFGKETPQPAAPPVNRQHVVAPSNRPAPSAIPPQQRQNRSVQDPPLSVKKSVDSRPAHSPQRRPAAGPRASRAADTLLIVAIVAAVIALAALVFGMSAGNMPFMSK